MEEQNEVQTIKNKKSIWITVFLIIIFSLIAGIIIFAISKSFYSNKINILNTKILTLEKSLSELKSSDSQAKNVINENNDQKNVADSKKLEEQLNSINNNLINPISEYNKIITNWNTYKNDKFKFEVNYPNTFLFNENDEINQRKNGTIVKFLTFDGEAKNLRGEMNPGYYTFVTVSYWNDINNEYAKGGRWDGERRYDDLDDLFTEEWSPITKNGEITIDGKKAYDVTIAGHNNTHAIMIEFNNGLYRIDFPFIQNPPNQSVKEQLISSFKFVD